MTLAIEPGAAADLDAIEQLYNDVTDALESGVNYPGWKKGIYPARQDAEAGLSRRQLYVARSGGRIAGSIILSHEPEEAYHGAEWQYDGDYRSIFVVHTFVVHPAFSGLGIGRRLLQFAESLGAQSGIGAIRLDVYEKNTPAIRLYESCGYRYIATVDLGLGSRGLDWFRLYEKLIQSE